jgi:hypothetical protein
METSSIENKYKELLFLDSGATNPKLQFILLIHAINLSNDLKCTGLAEDDPESDFVLPPDWKKDSDGVYSFRYYDSKSRDTIYFKFVTEDTLVDINAVTASKNDKIHSLEFKLSDFSQIDSENISKIQKKYRNEFLVKVLPHLKPSEEAKTETTHTHILREEDRGFFWTMPRNEHPERTNNFGDYGKSDLFPVSNNPIDINSGGNLLGPRNPIFQGGQPVAGYRPKIRYDPTGPNDIDPSSPDPDIFFPPLPFQNKKDPKGPFGGGGFGGGGFGGGGFGGGNFF